MVTGAPRHGAVFAQILARDLLADGYSEAQIFARSGFEPDLLTADKPVAAFDDIAGLFEHAARLTDNDVLGFQRGQKRQMRRSGLIFYVGQSSPTVADFMHNIARYRRVFSDAVEIDTGSLDRTGQLKWYFNVPAGVQRRQYVEFGASGLLHAIRQAANRVIRPERVTFRHARNTNIEEFRRYFGCEVDFGAPDNMYVFRQSDLSLPLMTSDNDLYGVLLDHCRMVLSDVTRNVPPLIVDVERMIADRLASGEASQDQVARALGMSPRTLSRRLSAENTTFFETLENLRKSLSISYLKDSDLSLTEIAYLLGYSGLSSFSEAFKRWTGASPGQYRTG